MSVKTLNFPVAYDLRNRILTEKMSAEDQRVWEKSAPDELKKLVQESAIELNNLIEAGYVIVAQTQIYVNYMTKIFMVLHRPNELDYVPTT